MQNGLFFLNELTDLDIEWLLQVGHRDQVPAGTILIQEGRPIDALYVLLDGTSVVMVSALEGQHLAKLAAGDVVGELSFVDANPPSATVQTLDRSTVLTIPWLALAEKLQTDMAFAGRFYRALSILLSYRLRGMVGQVSQSSAPVSTTGQRVDSMSHGAIAPSRFEHMLHRLRSTSVAGQT